MKYLIILSTLLISLDATSQKTNLDSTIISLAWAKFNAKTSAEKKQYCEELKSARRKKKELLTLSKGLKSRFNDTISTHLSKHIQKLWTLSQETIIEKERTQLYSNLAKYSDGQIVLFENITYFSFDDDNGGFDELYNYPVFRYLIKNPSLNTYSYIYENICQIEEGMKLDFLLLVLSKYQLDRQAYVSILETLLSKKCLNSNQITSIKNAQKYFRS